MTTWWCLKNKAGQLEPFTFAPTKGHCWDQSFGIVSTVEGDEWQARY